MINLIPNQEKKRIERDFYLRLLAVFFSMLASAVVLGCLAILPSYFMSLEYKNLATDKLALQKNTPTPLLDDDVKSRVRDIDTKLMMVENAEKGKFIVSREVVNEILKEVSVNIKINSIFYNQGGEVGKQVSISGTASSREALLIFQQRLKSNKNFKEVDLPISNFVKGSNIDFTVSLIPVK